MSFFSALYRLLIGPLELFFEIIFAQANSIFHHPGLSIIFLSLTMNFLVLPLYKRADAMQEEERKTNERLKHWTAHIKKTFKGDERFMILQTYYRQNNYKPTDALKGSVSLLLEIPFFMAAYNFLSDLTLLNGSSLGPIINLAEPDGLLAIGGLTINILPILMTAINLVSSAIYTKGMSAKSKFQLYVMAALFLILLYDSPSGLVFYWTLNNLFSLVKNIFYKLKNPKKVLCILFSLVGAASLALAVIIHPMPTARSQAILCCLTLTLQLPLVFYAIHSQLTPKPVPALSRKEHMTFWVCGLFMTILTGVFIPSGLVNTSPEEFLTTLQSESPLVYVLNSTLTAAGFFLIWCGIFFFLFKDSGKRIMSFLMCALCGLSIIDFMFFGKNYGNISARLIFDVPPAYGQKLVNLIVLLLAVFLVWLLWKKQQELLRSAVLVSTMAAFVISAINVVGIHTATANKMLQLQQTKEDPPIISLSKEGKNVIVLMMDYGVGAYVPYLMNEKPELQEQFAGFTYYPNVISYGGHTNFGAPALFGGYEYTPEKMNQRADESLADKHNEALKVLPLLFSQAGFETTVCDAPYAGYNVIPDLSIYNEYPAIKKYNSMGKFDSGTNNKHSLSKTLKRNMFFYSLFKITPVFAQQYVYDGGKYNSMSSPADQIVNTVSTALGCNASFLRAYAVLENLPAMTQTDSGSDGTFLMLTNDTTHEPTLLQKPDYTPAYEVDNTTYDQTHADLYTLNGKTLKMEHNRSVMHYHVNVAAFLKLGQWFDYMREQGVFDNTRIIIVSDHGAPVDQIDGLRLGPEQKEDVLNYNPLLLVKDFDSTNESLITDTSFMTNADTPTLAVQDLIEDPVNPFTGTPIDSHEKFHGPQHILCSHQMDILVNNGNKYIPGPWFSVEDDIFDLNNWEYLGVE